MNIFSRLKKTPAILRTRLAKITWKVRQQHDQVVIQMNNVDIAVDYETAFWLSHQLRFEAKRAKIFAGDLRKIENVSARLLDAPQNYAELVKPNLRYQPEGKDISKGG